MEFNIKWVGRLVVYLTCETQGHQNHLPTSSLVPQSNKQTHHLTNIALFEYLLLHYNIKLFYIIK